MIIMNQQNEDKLSIFISKYFYKKDTWHNSPAL